MTLPLPAKAVPAFLLMTDPERRPDPLADAARLRPGQAVILRHYGSRCRAALAHALARAARTRRAPLLVAGDWRLAAAVRAQGVHLPQGMLLSGRLAPLLGWAKRRGALLTAACHDRAALRAARRLRIGAALVSPVFPTRSHPDARTLGLIGLARLARTAKIPVIALGGMAVKQGRQAQCRGAKGWASVTPPLSA